MSHRVTAVFDYWDLKEGQDLHSFMEQSVNRADVTHVLILCDPAYAQKANDREGGVGKETLIISPSVYESVAQKRVIPVIMERDSGNRVVVPTYLTGRRYIDLSEPSTWAEGYEQLLRALYDKPERVRPPLGTPPPFLAEDYVPRRTTAALAMFRNGLLSAKPNIHGLLADVLDRIQGAGVRSIANNGHRA